jgi:predicted dehydrogenase
LRIATRDAWVAVDYAKKEGLVFHRKANLQTIRDTVAKVKSGEITDPTKLNYAEMVKCEKLVVDNTEPLRAEQDAFIEAVTTKSRPVVSGEDGMASVDLAERIVKAMGATSL